MVSDSGPSDPAKPEFSALSQTLPPQYGNAALTGLENQFNYGENIPKQDFLKSGYHEMITPVNNDYRDEDQDNIEITVPGTNTDFIKSMVLCLDIQPWHLADNVALTEASATTLRSLQRPMTPFLMFQDVTLQANQNRLDFSSSSNTYAFNKFLHMMLFSNMEDEERLRKSHDFDLPPFNEDPDRAITAGLDSGQNGTAYQMRRRLKMIQPSVAGDAATAGRQDYVVPISIPILEATCLSVVGANMSLKLRKADKKQLFANSHRCAEGRCVQVQCGAH
jgi:hypothetical protein